MCAAFDECANPQLHELLRGECFAEQTTSEAYECALAAHRALDAIESQYAQSQRLRRTGGDVPTSDGYCDTDGDDDGSDDKLRVAATVSTIDVALLDGLLNRLRTSAVASCFSALDRTQLHEFDRAV